MINHNFRCSPVNWDKCVCLQMRIPTYLWVSVWMLYKTIQDIIYCNALRTRKLHRIHYNDVIMSTIASQITSLTIVYSSVYSGSKKTSKCRVTGLCAGNSPGTVKQRASNAENVSIWWRHHVNLLPCSIGYYRCEAANPPMTNHRLVDLLTSLEHCFCHWPWDMLKLYQMCDFETHFWNWYLEQILRTH